MWLWKLRSPRTFHGPDGRLGSLVLQVPVWRLGKPGAAGSSLKAAGFDQEGLMIWCESRGRKMTKPLRQEYSPLPTRGSAFYAVQTFN